VRNLLAGYGRLDFYEPLLALLGCEHMSTAQVNVHLDTLAGAYDDASNVITSPFFFASDITPLARPVAIDGSRELIMRGEHREAVFWIVATHARCLKVLHQDAPVSLFERHMPGFRDLLSDLGIAGTADLLVRADDVRAFLPRVWEVAIEIMDHNPRIET
jgi:hypothetical protein